jgi:hypothetical protein
VGVRRRWVRVLYPDPVPGRVGGVPPVPEPEPEPSFGEFPAASADVGSLEPLEGGEEEFEREPVPDDGLVPFELVLDALAAAGAASGPPMVRPAVRAVTEAVLGKWSFMVLRPF